MLYLFAGQVRNGKTVSLAVEAKKFFEAGYTIYSNTPFNFEHRDLTREMILSWEKNKIPWPPKSVACIDEIGAWFDSRNSNSSNNKTFSYFMSQLGKFTKDKQKGLTVIATTQFFNLLDVRGRRLTHQIIECHKIDEVVDDHIDVLRVWKQNENLILKTFKKELVRFDMNDFNIYDTQQEIRSVE